MVAKTQQGLEEVLAEELRNLGADEVEPGLRMVSFRGDLETLYRANFCCRTALRILKPFYKFFASSTEELYEMAKEYDWSMILDPDKSFAVDTVAYSEEFTHSRYATYRIKDAISDWFRDRYGDKRPRVSTTDPDIIINLHISGNRVTLSLDSSGESLHKRGYRVAQTEAPINEVLAAGIILQSGWRGDTPFIDPMCGSGTFLIEAALIAANINPGIFRSHFAFEKWEDFNSDIFDKIYNDDSGEKEITVPIIGADISPKAIAVAEKNIKSARLHKNIELRVSDLSQWEDAPTNGVIITNPPYGERLNPEHLDDLYALLGQKLKQVFTGYHAWVIGYKEEHFAKIGLAPSQKIPLLNGSLECKLREYIIFEGKKSEFRKSGGDLKAHVTSKTDKTFRRQSDKEWERSAKRSGLRAPTANRRSGTKKFERSTTPGDRFKRAFEEQENHWSNRRRTIPKSPNTPKKEKKKESLHKWTSPSLPPQPGPIMRERKAGWKKRPDWLTNSRADVNDSTEKS